mgnify:CR=1 FL=1
MKDYFEANGNAFSGLGYDFDNTIYFLDDKEKNKRNIDIQKGYTSIGIHRDDFEVFINDEIITF